MHGAKAVGVNCVGSDLKDRFLERPEWFLGKRDFFADPHLPDGCDMIASNPPYGRGKMAEAFVKTAIGTGVDWVCALTETRFLSSEARATGLFRRHPPFVVILVSPRPSVPPGEYLEAGEKAEGGIADFCWIVWHKTRKPRAPIFGNYKREK